MAEAKLDLQAGFLPYGDGSGYQVSVCIRDCDDGKGPMLTMNIVHEIEVAKWQEVVNGVHHLMRALPVPH